MNSAIKNASHAQRNILPASFSRFIVFSITKPMVRRFFSSLSVRVPVIGPAEKVEVVIIITLFRVDPTRDIAPVIFPVWGLVGSLTRVVLLRLALELNEPRYPILLAEVPEPLVSNVELLCGLKYRLRSRQRVLNLVGGYFDLFLFQVSLTVMTSFLSLLMVWFVAIDLM